ncbi:MAG: ABC transporter permease [Desulfovibrionaceae bacterium]|nr:ABC transporter permease [Desulfovibrionaceae bacterium]
MDVPWPDTAAAALDGLSRSGASRLRLMADNLGEWDTGLLSFLVEAVKLTRKHNIPVDMDLPEGLQRLIQLAFAVPAKEGAARHEKRQNFVTRLGGSVLGVFPRMADFLEFFGEVALAHGRLFTGRSNMRRQDFVAAMHECGVRALPIISITSLLFGLILAFVGAVQLTQFGAQIYVAGLVGIGMLRVMGAVMVGVVMSGRVGAAFAALIGTMQVNEEVDALATLGIAPVDFLVLPRILALMLMVPLLTLYADIMGILGGFTVGVFMLGLSPTEYINATIQMVPFIHLLIGLVYATVFGVVIGLAGCYHGMRCGRSAQAVGQATTTAVVHSIVGIIIVTAIITVICNILKV